MQEILNVLNTTNNSCSNCCSSISNNSSKTLERLRDINTRKFMLVIDFIFSGLKDRVKRASFLEDYRFVLENDR